MAVEIVTAQMTDGLRHEGALRLPDPGATNRHAIDAAIMLHGLNANFYGPSFFAQAQEALAARGIASIRVNTRGRDLMYQTSRGRLGAAYELVSDCVPDLKGWLDWAEAQGFRRTFLWGHSLGAVKAIYYLAHAPDARVPAVVASSPPRLSYAVFAAKEEAFYFRASLANAQRLVDAGDPDHLVTFDVPAPTLYTAKALLDKFDPDERYNWTRLVEQVAVPVLVTIGSLEGRSLVSPDWLPFGGLARDVEALAAKLPNLSFQLIEGANHGYSGKAEEMWQAAWSWLGKTLVLSA